MSIRAAGTPMDFTSSDFWFGARTAWLSFMLLLTVALIVLSFASGSAGWGSPIGLAAVVLMYGLPIGGIVSALAVLLFAAPAWALGRALRRVADLRLHAVCYVAFGAVAGAAVAMTAVAVPLGWWHAVRRTRRIERAPRVDPDAAHEDALPPG